jgi:hypothetical protein
VDINMRSRVKAENPAQKAATVDATKAKQGAAKNQVKTPTVQTKTMGKPTPNRPPSLLQRQNRSNGPYNRPFMGAGGGGPGNFGARNGGRFGPGGPGGPGNFQPGPFGGNNRQNFNRGGGGGGGNFGAGNQANVMDALQLLSQLRNNNGGGNDEGFFNRQSPKQDNFNNDFGGNFGGNRGNSFNNGPRNNFGGGGGGGNGGNGWFKVNLIFTLFQVDVLILCFMHFRAMAKIIATLTIGIVISKQMYRRILTSSNFTTHIR